MIKIDNMRILFLISCSLFLMTATAQDYITDEQMEETVMVEDDQVKLLYFTAPWCGPCRYMAPVMKSIAEDPSVNVKIYKMNTDDNKTDDILRVNSIPTYFFIKNGRKLGQSGSVMKREDLVKMIERHDRMKVSGDRLAYKGKPSQYELVAGAHEKLSVKNLETLWYAPHQLNELAWKIYQNLSEEKDLNCALVLANRSIELETFTSNLETKAHLLYKLNQNAQAKKAALKAKRHAQKNGDFTGIIDELLDKLATE
ncbi:thioredoxin family protein [Nonlabens xiamenensis]|uniref:thioredoxin family protein n=1 Tax=Nonlabens xiamenensis TaxID=2341043 RepID=UPI001F0C81F9|nr:thioredoxin family protein [Nonlabens xiamenensis]